MRIYDVVIDPEREDHIARHGVIPDEVREVIAGNFLVEGNAMGPPPPRRADGCPVGILRSLLS